MKTKLSLLAFMLVHFLATAQLEKADSMEHLLSTAVDTQKVFLLSEIGWEYMSAGQYDKADSYADQTVKLGESIKYWRGVGDGYNLYGVVANMRGDQKKAIEYHEKALATRRSMNDKRGISSSLNNIGNVMNYLGNYDKALGYFLQVLEINKEIKDSVAISSTMNNVAIANYYQGRIEEAIKYMLESATIREKIADPRLTNSYSNISAMYREMGNLDQSEIFATKSLQVAEKKNDEHGIASAYTNLGTIARAKKDYSKALDYFRKAQKTFDASNYAIGIINIHGNIARLYEEQNMLDSARFYLQKSISMAESTGNNTGLIDDLTTLADIFSKQHNYVESIKLLNRAEAIATSSNNQNDLRDVLNKMSLALHESGDDKRAFEYSQRYIHLTDSLFTEDMNAKVAEMQTRFDVNQMQIENEKLVKDGQIKELQAEQAKTSMYILGALLLAILLLAIVVITRIRSTQKLRLANEIAHQQKLGIAAVIEAQEEERKRIARELHDSVGQQLSSLKLKIQSQPNDHSLSPLLDQTIQEVRGISHQMLPVALEHYGLVPAVEELLKQSLKNSSIKYQFDHWSMEKRPAERVELTTYRICQELIANLIKHANATEFRLQIYQAKDNLIIMAEDNGRGIDTSASQKGMGMLNMQTRLVNLNGDLRLESPSGQGLLTTIKIPLAA